MQQTTCQKELQQLLADCIQNKRKAQHTLFKLFYSKAMGVCMRYANNSDEAQDMLNEGFLKVFANLKNYEHNGSFEAWIKKIMANTAIDYQRKYKTLTQTIDIQNIKEIEYQSVEINEALSKIAIDELIELIQKLPRISRTVFNLYIFEGYAHTEIAQMLNIKEGTSHWHLNFARNKLKEMIIQLTK